jgi:hypothetical protein
MTRRLFNQTRLVRRISLVRSFAEAEDEDQRAWRRMTPRQRLGAMELWRQMNHRNYDPDTARLSRVLEIVKPSSR